MKVVYTDEALTDIDQIADWLIAHYPAIAPTVGRRIQAAYLKTSTACER